jgi:guanylate kinase
MNRIIICGKSGSGKDTLRKRMQALGFVYANPYTTRPPRNGEDEHNSYVFIDKDHFKKLIESDFFFEYTIFNEWYYGTSKYDWSSLNTVFVMSPSAISKINDSDIKKCFIIYLDIDEETRRERILSRIGNADSVERRINADEEDFKQFTTYNLKITNADF